MVKIDSNKDCCGCTACASICGHGAITMVPDEMGFLYPKIDLDKCSDCGLCERVCAFNDDYDKSLNYDKPLAFGARHKDMSEVMTSRSGAAFVALSDYVIEHGGVVYGAGYVDHFRVAHKRATTKVQRDEFKGSKYVQSDLTDVFHQVKQDIKDGKLVLFSGTPCQTAGLNSYIGKKLRGNLILVDIVCHGVPSPYIWRDYISYLEQQKSARIIEVNFRDKSKVGWKDHVETYKFDNDTSLTTNDYTKLFYKHIILRESCENCHFCNTTRPSDITIADFWGWEKTNPEINKDDKGISLILINTNKGLDLYEKVKDCMTIFEANLEDCLQRNLKMPSEIPPKRYKFVRDYINKGFLYVKSKDYNKKTLILRIAGKIKRVINPKKSK